MEGLQKELSVAVVLIWGFDERLIVTGRRRRWGGCLLDASWLGKERLEWMERVERRRGKIWVGVVELLEGS